MNKRQQKKKGKAQLFLVPGKKLDDIQVLINLYTKLTGREPTEEEIKEAMAEEIKPDLP